MCVIREMKRFKSLLIGMFILTAAIAQENDTSLLRELGVTQLQKYLFVHAFIDNHDTCLYYHQELDTQMRTVYEKVNMRCYGYNDFDEYRYSYDSSGLRKLVHDKEDGPFNITMYEFNEHGQPSSINSFFFRTNDSSLTKTVYYQGKHSQPDSSITTIISQEGDTVITKTIARFNELGLPVQIMLLDDKRELLQDISYEYDDSLLTSSATTVYGEQAGFMQTYYEYDQHKRLVFSYNTVNQKQEYYYLDNGLLNNILNYNPKGVLESEFIYKYEYK